jgi:hypothetical protein
MDDLREFIVSGLLREGVVVEAASVDTILEMEGDFLEQNADNLEYSIDDVARYVGDRLKTEHNIEVGFVDLVRLFQFEDAYMIEKGFMTPIEEE